MSYFNKIRLWAKEKNILNQGDIKTQYIKLQEEAGELAKAILNNDNAIKWSFLASTSHVYSSSKKKIKENFSKKPISYYGKTKLFAEQNFIKLKKRKIKVKSAY